MKEDYRVFIGFNREHAIALGCSEKEVAALEQELNIKKFSPKDYRKTEIPPEFLVLKSTLEERALVKSIPHNKKRLKKMIIESPSTLTARQRRLFTRIATKFFNPLFEKEAETVPLGQAFQIIMKRPYQEHSFMSYDPRTEQITGEYKTRYRTNAEKMPWGSNTGLPQFYKKRNAWIKKEYCKLRKKRIAEQGCYSILKEKLCKLSLSCFGKQRQPKNGKPFELSEETIKFIVHSKNS